MGKNFFHTLFIFSFFRPRPVAAAILVSVVFGASSCRNHQPAEPSPPETTASFLLGSGETISGIQESRRLPQKINLRGVVKNAVAVKKDSPLRLRFAAGGFQSLSMALGVVPTASRGPVKFTVLQDGVKTHIFELNPILPEGWREVNFPLELKKDDEGEKIPAIRVECDLAGDGAYVAHPHLSRPAEGFYGSQPSLAAFILIDALRADALGVYGRSGNPSPRLDELARQGVVFTRAYTASPFTLTSVASIFTGLFPWQHRVIFEKDTGLTLSPELPHLVREFRKAGYLTAAFSGTYFRFSKNGFAAGFDSFDETCAASFFRESADCLTPRVLAWLSAHPQEQIFLYLHYVDPHQPYYAPEPFRHRYTQGLAKPWFKEAAVGEAARFGRDRPWYLFFWSLSPKDLAFLRGLYQGEVAYVDTRIGEVIKKIQEDGGPAGGKSLILVTADHGESFAEHGELEHVADLHDPVMRIPLFMAGAGLPPGCTIETPVRSVDFLPTLLELCGLKSPPEIAGRSLIPLLQDQQLPPAPAVAFHKVAGKPEYILLLWPWKLFYRPRTEAAELYRLDSDPAEKNNVAENFPTELNALLELLKGLLRETQPAPAGHAPTVDPETLRKLKALGYIR